MRSSDGSVLVTYRYDAWGNFTEAYSAGGSASIAVKNPFRYRGYYYDIDLGLYYNISRYYDSNTGRLINVDSFVSTGQGLTGCNMYAYCGNNPVIRVDFGGNLWEDLEIDRDEVMLEGAGAGGGFGGFGIGSAYHSYTVYSRNAAHDAFIGGYYYSGGSSRGGFTGQYAIGGSVSVGDTPSTTYTANKATTGTPNQKGKYGEQLANIDPKAKTKIEINDRTRIPDELNDIWLKEVKNVHYISNTQQLRDYALYAKSRQLKYILCVRPTTKISSTVKEAGWTIRYLW